MRWHYWGTLLIAALAYGFLMALIGVPLWFSCLGGLLLGWLWPRGD